MDLQFDAVASPETVHVMRAAIDIFNSATPSFSLNEVSKRVLKICSTQAVDAFRNFGGASHFFASFPEFFVVTRNSAREQGRYDRDGADLDVKPKRAWADEAHEDLKRARSAHAPTFEGDESVSSEEKRVGTAAGEAVSDEAVRPKLVSHHLKELVQSQRVTTATLAECDPSLFAEYTEPQIHSDLLVIPTPAAESATDSQIHHVILSYILRQHREVASAYVATDEIGVCVATHLRDIDADGTLRKEFDQLASEVYGRLFIPGSHLRIVVVNCRPFGSGGADAFGCWHDLTPESRRQLERAIDSVSPSIFSNHTKLVCLAGVCHDSMPALAAFVTAPSLTPISEKTFPANIQGLPVVLVDSGECKPLVRPVAGAKARGRRRIDDEVLLPCQIGLTCNEDEDSLERQYGTVGAFARRSSDNALVGLTNAHVLLTKAETDHLVQKKGLGLDGWHDDVVDRSIIQPNVRYDPNDDDIREKSVQVWCERGDASLVYSSVQFEGAAYGADAATVPVTPLSTANSTALASFPWMSKFTGQKIDLSDQMIIHRARTADPLFFDDAQPPRRVYKFGCTTGASYGSLLSGQASVRIDVEKEGLGRFEGRKGFGFSSFLSILETKHVRPRQLLVYNKDAGFICDAGDSGSLLLMQRVQGVKELNRLSQWEAIGLLHGRFPTKGYGAFIAVGCPLAPVLNHFDIELVCAAPGSGRFFE